MPAKQNRPHRRQNGRQSRNEILERLEEGKDGKGGMVEDWEGHFGFPICLNRGFNGLYAFRGVGKLLIGGLKW